MPCLVHINKSITISALIQIPCIGFIVSTLICSIFRVIFIDTFQKLLSTLFYLVSSKQILHKKNCCPPLFIFFYESPETLPKQNKKRRMFSAKNKDFWGGGGKLLKLEIEFGSCARCARKVMCDKVHGEISYKFFISLQNSYSVYEYTIIIPYPIQYTHSYTDCILYNFCLFALYVRSQQLCLLLISRQRLQSVRASESRVVSCIV